MKKIIIFGCGDFAQLATLYLEKNLNLKVAAYTLHKEYIVKDECFEKPLIPFEKIEDNYPNSQYDMFVALGYKKRNSIKRKIFTMAKSKGYNLISYISPKATVDRNTTKIGENSFISDNVTIEPFTTIGDNVTIWGGAFIAHHTIIGDHCFIAPRAAVAGRVTIEENCFLGVNSTIRDNVKIAKQSIIGAGAVILKDTQEGGVYKAHKTFLSIRE